MQQLELPLKPNTPTKRTQAIMRLEPLQKEYNEAFKKYMNGDNTQYPLLEELRQEYLDIKMFLQICDILKTNKT